MNTNVILCVVLFNTEPHKNLIHTYIFLSIPNSYFKIPMCFVAWLCLLYTSIWISYISHKSTLTYKQTYTHITVHWHTPYWHTHTWTHTHFDMPTHIKYTHIHTWYPSTIIVIRGYVRSIIRFYECVWAAPPRGDFHSGVRPIIRSYEYAHEIRKSGSSEAHQPMSFEQLIGTECAMLLPSDP